MLFKPNEFARSRIFILDYRLTDSLCMAVREAVTSPSFDVVLDCVRFSDCENGGKDLPGILLQFNPDLIVIVLPKVSRNEAERFFHSIRGKAADVPIVVAIGDGEADDLFGLFDLGMVDFIVSPFRAEEVQVRIRRLLNRASQGRRFTEGMKESLALQQIVGESAALREEISKVGALSKCDANVLITGETGTGKELVARAIHYLSSRRGDPFVPVNCGAIPVDLVENELFGHERGSFTGAYGAQRGLIQEADSGTLFLDEIYCLPPLAQVKLLRFFQEKEYRPIGASRVSKANVRIIAASNADFEYAVASGRFRRDLYYRLNVIPVHLPPLRERVGDIPLLAKHFLSMYSKAFNKPRITITPSALHKLEVYDWPGNIRELEHLIERAVVLCDQDVITSNHIVLPGQAKVTHDESFQEMKARFVSGFERRYIEGLLTVHNGNITKATEAAKKERRTFWELIRKHNIEVHRFKSDTA